MFSKPVYNNIKYPQPKYNHQLSITRLPSFNEVLTSIQLPNEFPLNKPAFRASSTVSSTNSLSPGSSPSPVYRNNGYSVGSSQYYYSYGYNYHPGRQSIMSVSTPVSNAPVPLESVSPKTLLPTPPPTNAKESKDQQRRKHTCKTCARSFTTSGHLARHNRIHTGERKHVCPWPNCEARFARQDNCMQHYKTHTNGKKRKNNLNFKNRSINSKSI